MLYLDGTALKTKIISAWQPSQPSTSGTPFAEMDQILMLESSGSRLLISVNGSLYDLDMKLCYFMFSPQLKSGKYLKKNHYKKLEADRYTSSS